MNNFETDLNKLAEDYRETLRDTYISLNNLHEEYSPHKLQNIHNSAKRAITFYSSRFVRKNKLTYLYIIGTLSISFFSILTTLLPICHQDIILNIAVFTATLCACACIMTAFTTVNYKKYTPQKTKLHEYDVIYTWDELEDATKDILHINSRELSIPTKDELATHGLISPEEESKIQLLLSYRNKILHTNEPKIPDDDLIEASDQVKVIIKKLRNQTKYYQKAS